MFSNPRRPVPSKAALKVLYQLAYISSGTAVGVATLCAEERRRRTQIAQKIADNAKRLRQSPRHVHNSATAAVQREEEEVDASYEPLGESRHERPRIRRITSIDGRAVREPELPSVVGRGYGQLMGEDVERDRRPKSNPERNRKPQSPGIRVKETCRHIEDLRSQESRLQKSGKTKSRGSHFPVPPVQHSATSVLEDAPKDVKSPTNKLIKNTLYRTYERSEGGKRMVFVENLEGDSSRLHMPKQFEKIAQQLPADDPIPRSLVDFEHLARDLDLFFQSQPWTESGRLESKIAGQLLADALHCGTMIQIRAICQWTASRNSLTARKLKWICDACRDLADREDPKEVFKFYQNLFESNVCKEQLSVQDQMRLSLMVSAEALSRENLRRGSNVAPHLIQETLRNTGHDDVKRALSEVCSVLLSQKKPYLAQILLKISLGRGNIQDNDDDDWLHLRQRIFDSALDNGHLWTCAKVLRDMLKKHSTDLVARVADFSLACRRQNAYLSWPTILTDKESRERLKALGGQLSASEKATIVVGCAYTHPEVHQHVRSLQSQFYDDLSTGLRTTVMEASVDHSLQSYWKYTRNLSLVKERYQGVRDLALLNGSNTAAITADVAMIEICNSANRPDQALELLSNLSQNLSHSSESLSMAAVSMAKKGAWQQLSQLLVLLGKAGSLVQDKVVSRGLSNVIQLFAHQHTAAETWKFVTGLVENLKFSPEGLPTKIMLQSFVDKQRVDLIPRWIRYLKTLGHQFHMDAKTAANLLRHYFLDQRPPHELLMWFCRSLARLSPSLDSAELEQLVKDSIAYDFRNSPTNLREKAAQNLIALLESEEGIPKPVKRVGNGHIESRSRDDGADLRKQTTIQRGEQVEGDKGASATSPEHDAASGERNAARVSDSSDTSIKPTVDDTYQKLVYDFNTDEHVSTVGRPETQDVQNQSLAQSDDNFFAAPAPSTEPLDARRSPPTPNEAETNRQDDAEQSVGSVSEIKNQAEISDDYVQVDLLGTRQGPLESEMILALSLKMYQRVLDLYRGSLSSEGLPASPLTLELATDAILRLGKGDRTEAQNLLDQARDAGFNVTCAMGPMLLQEMWHLPPHDKRDANKLRLMVIDYYRMNGENGWPVSHHIAVTAANILINNGRPEHGVNLLTAIYNSDWAQDRPLDIVAMTVYLKGFAALRKKSGLHWTIHTVLSKNMRIDKEFTSTLARCFKEFDALSGGRMGRPRNAGSEDFVARLKWWRFLCVERRKQQRLDSKLFGRKLVKVIAYTANRSMQPALESSIRKEVEGWLLGQPVQFPNQPKVPSEDVAVTPQSRLAMRRARAHMARSIRWEEGPRHHGVRSPALVWNPTWIKQYRKFLRSDIVMPDGKVAPFKYWIIPPRRPRRRTFDDVVRDALDGSEGEDVQEFYGRI